MFDLAGFWGHDGSIFGFNSIVLRNPKLDATFVILANKSVNDSPESQDIMKSLVKVVYPDLAK